MLLCDIGNTHYHFYENGKIWQTKVDQKLNLGDRSDEIYVISVNQKALEKLSNKYRVINLNGKFTFDTEYIGLGIDRAVACYAINDGVIIDAGSAITIDIMQQGIHLGGIILPGLGKFSDIYKSISPVLSKKLNFAVDLESLPQNTADAISYGIIGSVVKVIKDCSKNKAIFFTGGDGQFLSRFFHNSLVDKLLIFKGMEKIIKEISC